MKYGGKRRGDGTTNEVCTREPHPEPQDTHNVYIQEYGKKQTSKVS